MNPIQSITTDKKEIFLSFDDGPCPQTTPLILDVLEKYDAKASFFVVGEKALQHKDIIHRILEKGHGLGDHSGDHQYHHFFRGVEHLKKWVEDSQEEIKRQFGVTPIGFRSPAGVRTPPLNRALAELDVPWVHWKHRFFDTQFAFSESRFHKKIDQIDCGDIILLHDQQKPKFQKMFLSSLAQFVAQLKDKGFDFQPLKVERFHHANG